jgi:uncharacterized protein (DUF1778 family)
MARPAKDKRLLMNVPLRIMLTAEQKALIQRAADIDQSEMTAWARPILLEAARRKIAKAAATEKGRGKT